MLRTRVTEALGIKYPIIQGAMLWLSRAELVAAVSNAGGLGVIASGSFARPEELRAEIEKTRGLTNNPFAVNITLMPTRRALHPEELICTALEEGVRIIETSGRSPEPFRELLKQAGAIHLHKAARLRDALTAERLGAGMVTIVGTEAGGHPGMEDVTSLVRIPNTAASIKIPVIAAGGFADGRGLVAALALGAEAIMIGTRFMVSQESPAHPKIKEMLQHAQATDTMIIERSIQNAARVLRNELAERVLAMETKGATLDELYPLLRGDRVKKAYATGETEGAVFHCGQAVGLSKEVLSVKEIIDGIMHEAEEVVQRLRRLGLPV